MARPDKVIISCALTGSVHTPTMSPYLPVTPDQIAEQAIEAAKEQLTTIRGQKENLELQLAQMETEIKTLRVAQARSHIQLDDSRLAKVKNDLDNLRNRIKVEVRTSELAGQFVNETTVTVPSLKTKAEVIQEVEAYLNGTAATAGDRLAGK